MGRGIARETGGHRAWAIDLCLVLGLVAASGALHGCGSPLNAQLEHGVPLAAEQRSDLPGSAFKPAPTPTPGLGARSADGALKVPGQAAGIISSATPGDVAYKIGPLDVVEVAVFKVPDLSRVVQVSEAGTVNLPLVGETPVAGHTAQQIERDLTRKLGAKYLQSPQVNVYVREFNSQRITLEGAVRKPGVYPIRGKTTLLQVMATAEGINTEVATHEVVVFRVRDGKRFAAKFDVAEIRAGTAQDPQILAGDVIVVNTSDMKSAFNSFMKALPIASFLLLAL